MYQCIPVSTYGSTVQLALADALNPQVLDELGYVIGKEIQVVVADPAAVEQAINKHYGEESENVSEILKELGADQDIAREAEEATATEDGAELADLANETPIVRFVNLVLFQAIQDRASDIHFEPFEDEFKIRYRVDGALYEMSPPPKHLALPVISRLKVMANLNIAERRVPQDGRITFHMANRQVDLRMSSLPTQFGESVVLRVLDRSAGEPRTRNAGPAQGGPRLHLRSHPAAQRHLIVTGPTGSGKTTTLYSCLRRVNSIELKLLTAEDPSNTTSKASCRSPSTSPSA